MSIAKYTKQPVERKRYQIDYTDWLDTGENVATVNFSVSPVTSPTLDIESVANLPSLKGVQYYADGGKDGVTYKVTATLTTDASPQPQVREDEIIFVVREQ